MKKFINKIKEIKEMKNGKAILFFGFYFIFFLILFLILKLSEKNPLSHPDEYEKGNNGYVFHMDKILENNYKYTFTITIDGVQYIYLGQKNGSKEIIKFNNKDYFRNEFDFFRNDNIWLKCENPFVFTDFLDINIIEKIIETSSYESKTSFENGKQSYNLLISSNTLNQLLSNINSDFLEEPNKIYINTDTEKYVNEIKFNLDSYCYLNNLCQKSLEINLEYYDFGNILEIVNPIN